MNTPVFGIAEDPEQNALLGSAVYDVLVARLREAVKAREEATSGRESSPEIEEGFQRKFEILHSHFTPQEIHRDRIHIRC